MMKTVKLCWVVSIVILLCMFISGCLSNGPNHTAGSMEASDGQVTVKVNKLERSHRIPADVANELDNVPTLEENNDFILAYITITRIEGVHMVDPLGFENKEPILVDSRNNEYELVAASIKGIELVDPQDFENSPYEVVEGATGFLIFKIPKVEEASKINYIYSFKVTWEENLRIGQMDLILRP